MRPVGRLCTELHRHLTTAQDPESNPAPDTEDDEEEEDEEESESEEDEEEEESSSSEVEGVMLGPPEPLKPQFSSEKEMHAVVELITYMHTYCLPTRKQQSWERRDRDLQRSRARPDASRHTATNSHTRVVLVTAPGSAPALTGGNAPRKLPFSRRREAKANSLLRELLQQSSAFDVSKPYRLHSPPYSHSPLRGQSAQAHPLSSNSPKPESCKDSAERSGSICELAKSPEVAVEAGGSFSVRRSLRLASFPSRFAKRLRPIRSREGEGLSKDGAVTGDVTTETEPERLMPCGAELNHSCCHHGKTARCLLPGCCSQTSAASGRRVCVFKTGARCFSRSADTCRNKSAVCAFREASLPLPAAAPQTYRVSSSSQPCSSLQQPVAGTDCIATP